MADISKITLPNGVTYTFKDEVARAAVATGMVINSVEVLPTASQSTQGAIYIVPSTTATEENVFDEYITVQKDGAYQWEKIGTTQATVDMTGYSKDAHTHAVTPAGDVNISIGTGATNYTPEGTITKPSVTVSPSKTLYTVTSDGTYTPSKYTKEAYTVINETLQISPSAYTPENVVFPTREEITLSATSSAPTFSGKGVELKAVFSGDSTTTSEVNA